MGDMEQLRQLVANLMNSNAEAQVAADQRLRDLLQQLIAARPDAAAIRAGKIAKLGAALRSFVALLTPCQEKRELAFSETGLIIL